MLEQGRISNRQLLVLLLLAQIGDMILIYPAVITFFAHQDAWLSSLLGIPVGLVSIWIMLKFYHLQPGMTLVEAMSSIWGKWIGALVNLWYLFFFFTLTVIATREVGDFLTTQIIPNTPIRIVHLVFVIVLLWGVLHGIESLARTGEILLPLVTLFIVFLIICILPQADADRLKPVLGSGWLPLVKGMTVTVAYPFGELTAFMMLLPYTVNVPHRKKDIMLTSLIGGLLLTGIVMISIMVLGAFFTQHNIYASFILSQRISIGNFLERIEAIMATVWIISTYFKAVIYFYCFLLGFAQLFKLKTYRPLILPSGMMLFGMAIIIAPNITYYVSMIVYYWVDWDITCSTVIPLLAIIAYKIRNRGNNGMLKPTS